jgi:hypothetical protein
MKLIIDTFEHFPKDNIVTLKDSDDTDLITFMDCGSSASDAKAILNFLDILEKQGILFPIQTIDNRKK